MNHKCHGDRMTLYGDSYYRCLADATVVIGNVADGDPCPNCERIVAGVDQGELKTRRMVKYEYEPPGLGWHEFYPIPEPPGE